MRIIDVQYNLQTLTTTLTPNHTRGLCVYKLTMAQHGRRTLYFGFYKQINLISVPYR